MDLLNRIRNNENLAVLLLLLLGALLLFTRAGAFSLTEVDEARFAEVAREMLERDEWLSPHFNYAPYFNKPPLCMWLTAASYKVFGVSEAVARMWSALFGLGTALATLFMGRILFGRRAAFIGAIILLTTIQWTAEARLGLLNVALTFFITFSLLALLLAVKRNRPQYYLLFFLSMGLGVLTKGPVAIFFPGLIGLIYLAWSRRMKDLLSPWVWSGFACMLLVALPWHVVQWQRYGSEFLGTYFGYHMVARYTAAIEEHGAPQYYYPLILLLGMLPWSGFLPGALMSLKRLWHEHREGIFFLVVWFLSIYIFFTLGRTKLPGYVTPLYPPLSLLLGAFIGACRGGERRLRVSYIFLTLTGLLLLAAVPVLYSRVPGPYQFYIKFIIAMGAVSTLGGLAGWLVLALSSRRDAAMIFGVLQASLLLGVLYLGVLPLWDANKPTRPLCAIATRLMPPAAEIASYGLGENSSPFYLKRVVAMPESAAALADWMSAPQPRYAMLPAAALKEIEALSGREFAVAGSYEGSDMGEYLLIANMEVITESAASKQPQPR